MVAAAACSHTPDAVESLPEPACVNSLLPIWDDVHWMLASQQVTSVQVPVAIADKTLQVLAMSYSV